MSIQNIFLCFSSQKIWSADHAKETNHTTTNNIVLMVYFVTVLCHIVNMSTVINTVQLSNTIKVFLNINEEETKPYFFNFE